MLLIHILLNSGSVETFSCVYTEIMSNIISFFQKLIKGGWNKSGGWKIFQKLISGGGGDYSVLESKLSIKIFMKISSIRGTVLKALN